MEKYAFFTSPFKASNRPLLILWLSAHVSLFQVCLSNLPSLTLLPFSCLTSSSLPPCSLKFYRAIQVLKPLDPPDHCSPRVLLCCESPVWFSITSHCFMQYCFVLFHFKIHLYLIFPQKLLSSPRAGIKLFTLFCQYWAYSSSSVKFCLMNEHMHMECLWSISTRIQN